METLSFAAAMRTLIDDARWNFTHVRGNVQDGSGPVIRNFDVSFAVEGAVEAYVHLLDYDVPLGRIDVYHGDDDAAAALVFDAYSDRLVAFAAGPGVRSELTQGHEGPRVVQWSTVTYQTEGPPISVVHVTSKPPHTGQPAFRVWVEVRGLAIECIEGSPDDSPWRIMLGHD